MGQVIAIKEATRVAAGDPALTFIDECYKRLAALPGFIVRPGQKDLSYAVCKALVAGEPLAAEAPTGTGKTIAYLVGAVAAGEKLAHNQRHPHRGGHGHRRTAKPNLARRPAQACGSGHLGRKRLCPGKRPGPLLFASRQPSG